MNYDELSREALIARLNALEAERRAAGSEEALLREQHLHQTELELQNEALQSAQRELEASHRRYSDLYDFAPTAYITLDRKGVILEANLSAAVIFGCQRSRMLGKPLMTLARFTDSSQLWSHLDRCFSSRDRVTSDLRFVTARGIQHVQAISTPVLDPEGKPTAARTAFMDIRALKETEHDLECARASEANLRARLERVATAHMEITRAIARMEGGALLDVLQSVVNQAREIVGAEYGALGLATGDALLVDRWVVSGLASDLAMTIDVSQRRSIMSEAQAIRGDVARRFRELRGDQSFAGLPTDAVSAKNLLAIPLLYGEQCIGLLHLANKVGADSFSQADELTASMLAERTAIVIEIAQGLDRERRRLELLRETGSRLAKIVLVTDALEQICSLAVPRLADVAAIALRDSAGVLRVKATKHRDPERASELQRLHGVALQMDREMLTPVLTDGSARVFDRIPAGAEALGDGPVLLVPLRDDIEDGLLYLGLDRSGRSYGEHDMALALDFADRAVLAIENARLHEIARRAVFARDDLLSFVSHDIRNLAGTVLLSAQLLAPLRPQGERRMGRRYVDSIMSAAARMEALLDALRDAAMVETGQFTISPNPNDLRQILTEATTTLRPHADAKTIHLEIRVPPELPSVWCDRERVHQVLANLMGNAIEHTPRGGTITIEAAAVGQSSVQITVSDTGQGIAADDLPHIFERYWQKNLGGRGRKGSGLGLFISKGIVDAHGGHFHVASEVGRGSSFSFSLLLAPPAGKADGSAPKLTTGNDPPTRSGTYSLMQPAIQKDGS